MNSNAHNKLSLRRFSLLLSSAAVRWMVAIGVAAVISISLVLLFLLTQATNNRAMYESNYALLFGLNVVVAVTLLVVIGWIAVRLFTRWRRGRFGSRLLVKLAAIFVLLGFIPGVLIYVVSYQFVSRSIESWFDLKVEGALTAGVSLGRASLDNLVHDATQKVRTAAVQLSNVPDARVGVTLERLLEQYAARDITLWSASGKLVASAAQSRFTLSPERPSTFMLRNMRNENAMAQVDGLDDTSSLDDADHVQIKALAQVASDQIYMLQEARFLQMTLSVPTNLVTNAIAIQQAHREYQERALAREGLRRMYIGTLTLSLFLAVFGAVLLAVLFGNQLARPLLVLAEGVRQVAAGDLTPKTMLQSKDELAGLTRAFADMTQQLSDARTHVEKSMLEVTAARTHLQVILDNLTAGVIVFDRHGKMLSFNPGATRILRAPLAAFQGEKLSQIPNLAEFALGVQNQFDVFTSQHQIHRLDYWQHAFELHPTQTGVVRNVTSIVARGAELPDATRLLVFDDISEIVSAQRAQAWGDVARRLAHEIKNPLTPIQLSAERLEMKLKGKLPATEEALLTRSVKTIVTQVNAMQRLVNEFRDYARLPSAELVALDLNGLIQDILNLYENEAAKVPVVADLDPQCRFILGDAQQIQQIVHNLVQNAQDATEGAERGAEAATESTPVIIQTSWLESSQQVRLSILDGGAGFSEVILKRAFEPYVTTKDKGTGLGLAVVKKIADEHGARINIGNRIVNGQIKGAQVSLLFGIEQVN